MSFKLYDVRVMLNGSRNNEVRKYGVTAPEIHILGALHGPDSVPEVIDTKKKADRTDAQERDRLAAIYETTSPARVGFVRRTFGPATIPLPKAMEKGYTGSEKVNPDSIPAALREHIEPNAALM